MWFGTALPEMVRLKFEITLHDRVNELKSSNTPQTCTQKVPIINIVTYNKLWFISGPLAEIITRYSIMM